MRNAVILLFLAFFSVSLLAQSPDIPALARSPDVSTVVDPVAPNGPPGVGQIRPKHETLWMIAGFTLDATARGLDAYSTSRAIKNKSNQELILPDTIVKSQPAVYGFGASIVLTEYLGYRFLKAHHHEKIARWLPYVDAALVFPFAVHNLSLPHKTPSYGNSGPVITVQIR